MSAAENAARAYASLLLVPYTDSYGLLLTQKAHKQRNYTTRQPGKSRQTSGHKRYLLFC